MDCTIHLIRNSLPAFFGRGIQDGENYEATTWRRRQVHPILMDVAFQGQLKPESPIFFMGKSMFPVKMLT